VNIRAILLVILVAGGLAGALSLWAVLLQPGVLSTPQTLTLFALWAIPGYVAGILAREAGTLHGLLSGLLGMPLVYFGLGLISLDMLLAGSAWGMALLAGFWSSLGGMAADLVRLIRAKRAARKAADVRAAPKP